MTHIIDRGAEWFAKIGRNEKNTGPKLYCLSGHVNRPGVYEAPMGLPLKELLFGDDYGRGMKDGRKVKAVIPGGASAPMLTADEIEDCPLDFDGVAAKKSMLGSAAIIVMDEDTCIVDAVAEPREVLLPRVLRPVHALPRGDALAPQGARRGSRTGEGRVEDVDLLDQHLPTRWPTA